MMVVHCQYIAITFWSQPRTQYTKFGIIELSCGNPMDLMTLNYTKTFAFAAMEPLNVCIPSIASNEGVEDIEWGRRGAWAPHRILLLFYRRSINSGKHSFITLFGVFCFLWRFIEFITTARLCRHFSCIRETSSPLCAQQQNNNNATVMAMWRIVHRISAVMLSIVKLFSFSISWLYVRLPFYSPPCVKWKIINSDKVAKVNARDAERFEWVQKS